MIKHLHLPKGILLIFLFLALPHMPSRHSIFSGSQLAAATLAKEAGSIGILAEGRIKPLDTYARNVLLHLSGKSRFDKQPAIDWLFRLLFEPQKTAADAVFLVNNPQVATAIGIASRKGRRYSLDDIRPGIEKLEELASAVAGTPVKTRTDIEKAIYELYSKVMRYTILYQTFLYLAPHQDFTINNPDLRTLLEVDANQVNASFYDIYRRISTLTTRAKAVAAKDPNNWSLFDQSVFSLSRNLYDWVKSSQRSPFTVVVAQAQENQWRSPFHSMTSFKWRTAQTETQVEQWHQLFFSYRAQRQDSFDQASQKIIDLQTPHLADSSLDLERQYNRVDPFYRSKILYLIGFIACLVLALRQRRWLYRLTYGTTLIALMFHSYGQIARMIVMGRPPVTNLFETFIFVGLVGVILCLILEYLQRSAIPMLAANFSGFLLLMVSGKFASDGDTMRMLVAVLDSNFWLATHVVTISMGYAACIIAGIFGHIHIIERLLKRDRTTLITSYKSIYGILAAGLVLSFIGTVLGGIWADQSWGRFWGWDPKENGALMIVIWCAILMHARLSKMVGQIGLAYGAIIGIIIVVLAWFGINLLGVGLHSYGFTTGIAGAMFGYFALEVLFMAITGILLKRQTT